MNIVKPEAMLEHPIDGEDILERIERAGRTCYKSEDKMDEGSSRKFVRMILKSGHHSVIEHVSISIRFICDRGISHEIVRHRIASYSQESTRYCNYNREKHGGGELNIIEPPFDTEKARMAWRAAMAIIQTTYNQMIDAGEKPQIARSILPNCLKTELVMTANLREWRHFFILRCGPRAHPQIRVVAKQALKLLQEKIPVIFDDIDSGD